MVSALRVGIVGTGFAGEGHAAAYGRLPGVEVTALWNRTRSRAESLAVKLGSANVMVFDEWQGLVRNGGCDVISIATAPMLRRAPLLEALDSGCHVLVEKPMSIGVPEAQIMANAAGRCRDGYSVLIQLALRAGVPDSDQGHPVGPTRRYPRCAHRVVRSNQTGLLQRGRLGCAHGRLEWGLG